MSIYNLHKLKNKSLLCLYSDLIEELRNRKLIRSSNNPVADYAEYIIAKKLKLKLTEGSNKGFDATDSFGFKYQIKSRRFTRYNQSKQIGVIRNLDSKPFDFLIVVFFSNNFSVSEIWKIPHKIIKKYSHFSKLQNGHILRFEGKILQSRSIKRINFI